MLEPLSIQPIAVLGTQVSRGLLVAQRVVEDHQQGMRHRQGGAPLAPPTRDPVIERGEGGVGGAGKGLRHLAQQRLAAGTARPRARLELFVPTLRIARADPRPGGRVVVRREDTPVRAQLRA
jgi:hypothetical protein